MTNIGGNKASEGREFPRYRPVGRRRRLLYDELNLPDGKINEAQNPLDGRTIPLFAVETLEPELLEAVARLS